MSDYREHAPPTPLLLGYDPCVDLPPDHLARFVEMIVEECARPLEKSGGKGQPQYDPRLLLKVLVYGYATGVRSSRTMERLCHESLPYLFLTRGAAPSYRTLCSARLDYRSVLEEVWSSMFAAASRAGIRRLGRIVLDSTKIRANASGESVVRQSEYAAVLEELARILGEAAFADESEEEEGVAVQTTTGQVVELDQMRDILRRVRGGLRAAKHGEDAPQPVATGVSIQMLGRIEQARGALEEAQSTGLKHVSVTDPDARMMGEGCQKQIKECHSLEVGVDNGLLVAGESTQDGCDNRRLEPLVAAAKEQEPDGLTAVDADSGYYSGETVGRLLEAGLDTCIPDSNTAGDLHSGHLAGTTRDRTRGNVPLTYDAEADCYLCPEGNALVRISHRRDYGQFVTVYRAKKDCRCCRLASECLTQPKAKHKTLKVADRSETLETARQRFSEPEHIARYRRRGPAVETVFAYMRAVLGYTRWLLRGKERVAAEATLFKVAYQTRKIHLRWAASLSIG
jgi:transposase